MGGGPGRAGRVHVPQISRGSEILLSYGEEYALPQLRHRSEERVPAVCPHVRPALHR